MELKPGSDVYSSSFLLLLLLELAYLTDRVERDSMIGRKTGMSVTVSVFRLVVRVYLNWIAGAFKPRPPLLPQTPVPTPCPVVTDLHRNWIGVITQSRGERLAYPSVIRIARVVRFRGIIPPLDGDPRQRKTGGRGGPCVGRSP